MAANQGGAKPPKDPETQTPPSTQTGTDDPKTPSEPTTDSPSPSTPGTDPTQGTTDQAGRDASTPSETAISERSVPQEPKVDTETDEATGLVTATYSR